MEEKNNNLLTFVVSKLTDHQSELRAFITASIGNYTTAQDVLQKTNIAIWNKASTFRTEADFLPWAIGIARFEVLAYYRDRRRDRLTFFPEIGELLGDIAEKRILHLNERQVALKECLNSLPKVSRQIIDCRYGENKSISEIGKVVGKTVPSVRMILMRVRNKLGECIEWRLKEAQSR